MAHTVYGKDKKELVVHVEELEVIRRKLQEQVEKLKKKIKAQHEKKEKIKEKSRIASEKAKQEKAEFDRIVAEHQRASAAFYNAKYPLSYWPYTHNRKIKSCEKKKMRYQRTIDELKNEEFCIDLQIRLHEARINKPIYDGDSFLKGHSFEKDMTMSNDELVKTANESRNCVEYMQLKPLAKFQYKLTKPVILMKNRLCKLFSK